MEELMEREIKGRIDAALANCVLEVMKICEDYDLDRDCMIQQAVDMLDEMVSHYSFRYFKS